jgi:glycine cleavage system H protein
MASDVRSDRRYTKDHEWARAESGAIEVGITAYAVDQLGDITLLNLDVKPGDTIAEGKAFGTIESVKTLSDLFAPIAGKVVAVNDELVNKPESVNGDCWAAWMVRIEPADPTAVDALMDADAYAALLASIDH